MNPRLSSPFALSAPVSRGRWRRRGLALAALLASTASQAYVFGPNDMFSLTGFAEATLTRANNQCGKNRDATPTGNSSGPGTVAASSGFAPRGCQFDPDTDRQRIWTDDVVPGHPLRRSTTSFYQIQPYLGAKYALGKGFKVEASFSQRWRDGDTDVKGFVFEKNVAISHEDYGSVRVGHMTTRTWSFTDYPYSSEFGLSNAFANTGAGYGLLTRALRVTTRTLDIAGGDVLFEVTYDQGDTSFKRNDPFFIEGWAHYGNGDLVLDAMMQVTRNGGSVAWGHAPFKRPAFNVAADAKIGGSGQAVAILLGRYKLSRQLEVTGGIRRNRWSGATAVIVDPGTGAGAIWNNMFNVDWGGTRDGVPNPGYAANSVDLIAGLTYHFDKWVVSSGAVYLGKANTKNPSDRGQRNTALVNTARLGYHFGNGLELYSQAGLVHFKHQGLAPLSMPSHSAIQNIDSRTTNSGNWFALGALYSF